MTKIRYYSFQFIITIQYMTHTSGTDRLYLTVTTMFKNETFLWRALSSGCLRFPLPISTWPADRNWVSVGMLTSAAPPEVGDLLTNNVDWALRKFLNF
jgi:hypothetical protein